MTMDSQLIIPNFPEVPFPGPLWLLQALLLIGFFLHAIPMNVALMGGLVSGLFVLAGKGNPDAYPSRLGNALAKALPLFVSFAITMGVVPLLFLQLVYGPLFYTSSIMMAVPWAAIIPILLTGYYGYYLFTYRRRALGRLAPWVLITVSVLFLFIAFFFTNNTTLMLRPELWQPMYQNNPFGLNLNWDDPQLWPRFLHFVVAAVAVTSLVIGSFGVYFSKREPDYGSWLIRTASNIFLGMTVLQFPIGFWFLFALPETIRDGFMGGDPTGTPIFMAAMTGDLIALGAMFMSSRNGKPLFFNIGVAATAIVIGLMIGMRHLVRVWMTEPYFRPEAHPVEPQWGPMIIFGVGGAFLIGYMIWLARVAWGAFHPKETENFGAGSAS
jgi:hypothetical protein